MSITKQIDRRLFYTMPLKRTDVGMVLGCRSATGSVARVAGAFYRQGVFQKLIVSGGVPIRSWAEFGAVQIHHIASGQLARCFNRAAAQDALTQKTEADYAAEILAQEGVPAEAIILKDSQSRNTQQNFENCLPVLQQFRSATLVTYAPLQRRALGTARFYPALDHVLIQTAPVYPFGVDKGNWRLWPIGPIVRGEFEKMNPHNPKSYLGKYCRDPDINTEIRLMASLPRVSGQPS